MIVYVNMECIPAGVFFTNGTSPRLLMCQVPHSNCRGFYQRYLADVDREQGSIVIMAGWRIPCKWRCKRFDYRMVVMMFPIKIYRDTKSCAYSVI